MLRPDVFDETHKYILDFWKEIMYTFGDDDALVFTASFASYYDIAPKISSELYDLCKSYANLSTTLYDLEFAQREIKTKLGTPKLLDMMKARIELARGTSDMSPENKRLLEEYYEIEDSISLLNHDMENIAKVILRERQKLWNRIDTVIISTYKQLLYDITGSDKFAEAFMKEMMMHVPVKHIGYSKRNRDYELLI